MQERSNTSEPNLDLKAVYSAAIHGQSLSRLTTSLLFLEAKGLIHFQILALLGNLGKYLLSRCHSLLIGKIGIISVLILLDVVRIK